MTDTPASLGYRMPAEWERHEATWISWPKDPDTFPGGILPKVEAAYVQMVRALGDNEEVRVIVDDEKAEARVGSILRGAGRVSFLKVKTVDVWVRDYGPTCVKGTNVALVKWVFNAWGGKYDDLRPDDEAGERLARSTGLKTFRPGIVLEGGSIDVNGTGSLLTTEQCLLNANRNPGLGKKELEGILRDNLGVSNVVWLGKGIEGDDTDGHIDDIARFVGTNKVLIAAEQDRSDPNNGPLEANRKTLEMCTDEKGRSLEVIEVPMPAEVTSPAGRLPASHLNFYIGNGCVLVPVFKGSSDRVALRTVEQVMPEREVVGVDCRALVYGLGALHCVTQQVPSLP